MPPDSVDKTDLVSLDHLPPVPVLVLRVLQKLCDEESTALSTSSVDLYPTAVLPHEK